MKTDRAKDSSDDSHASVAASELNNLLEIISGTSAAIENIWDGTDGSQEYFDMLRESVDRAAKVTARLVEHAGGTDKKVLFHPELAPISKRKPSPTPVSSGSGVSPQTLLVVDNEPMALVLSKRVLSEAGFDVVTAQSGFECLDLFRSQPARFDLVLLDLTMPFMDGEETFERLKNIRSDVVVLLTAGFIAQERLDRIIAAGMVGFLRKPHSPGELVTNIRGVLERLRMSRVNCSAEDVGNSG